MQNDQNSEVEGQQIQPVSQDVPVNKKSPAAMLSSLFAGLKGKLKRPKKAANEGVVEGEVKLAKNKIFQKSILVVVAIVVIIIILLVIMSLVGNGGNGGNTPAPTASSQATSTPKVEVPSQYADDEDVVEIIDQMKLLDEELKETNFREDTLRLPNLDWDVNFE